VHNAGQQGFGKSAPGSGGARTADFMQALTQELREQVDPVLAPGMPAAGAGTMPVKGLPSSGKGSPQPLPVDPDAPPADGTAALSVVTGLMPLPVQPQAATDAKVDQVLTSTTQQNTDVPIGSANGGQSAASRGLLAMLEHQAGANSAADKGDAAALRSFAATLSGNAGSAIDATSLTPATSIGTSGRDQPLAPATTTPSVGDAPSVPSASSVVPAAAPSDATRVQTPVAHIEQPVGGNAWHDAVGHQVTWMVEQQVGRAELRLHPAHLGPIEVSVTVNNDEVNVSFQASHPATREALENSLPRLRELLGHSGLSLGQASVSQQFAGGERTPERSQAPERGGGSQFDERATQIEMPIATRVRVGLLDAYA
jgi:flagellar hook-length control protein FliK